MRSHENFPGQTADKDCDEAGAYVLPNVLSPRDLVFRPDIGHKLYHHHLEKIRVNPKFWSGSEILF